MNLTSHPPTATASAEHAGASSAGPSTSSAQPGTVSSPVPVTPISAFSNPSPIAPSGSSVVPGVQSPMATGSVGVQPAVVSASPLSASNLGSTGVPSTLVNTNTKSVYGFLPLFFSFC